MSVGEINPLISIIVPIYKTEAYLQRCVDSILAQTYENLEVILVDDGSPDGCPEICDEYAKKDARVRVIHKENGGLSSARNAGLDIAQGDYIGFVDSDDVVDEQMYSVLANIAQENGTGISGVGGLAVYPETAVEEELAVRTGEIKFNTHLDFIRGLLLRKSNCSVCSKLFSAELFKKHRFKTGRLNEDMLLLCEMFFEEKCTYAYTEDYYYLYFQREGSICHSGFSPAIYDMLTNYLYIESLVCNAFPELVDAANDAVLFATRTYCMTVPYSFYKENKDKSSLVLKEVRARRKTISGTTLSKRDKTVLKTYARFPRATVRFLNLIKRRK